MFRQWRGEADDVGRPNADRDQRIGATAHRAGELREGQLMRFVVGITGSDVALRDGDAVRRLQGV
jgi:hypothetical protein